MDADLSALLAVTLQLHQPVANVGCAWRAADVRRSFGATPTGGPMDNAQMALIEAPLAQWAGRGAGAMQEAHAVGVVWHAIDLALSPIIGAGGVVALFQRSVHLTAAQHPWLRAGLEADGLAGLDVAAFTAMLARQDTAQALACGNTLLGTFHGLLTSLIGASLTERLLRPVWGPPPISAPAQDMPP